MSCGEANSALLDSLEAQSRLVEQLRASKLDSAWREALLEQADRGRRVAFETWRAHLAEPVELDVEISGGYATIQYGEILRILPEYALRSERALLLVAEALWEGEHRRPLSEECAFAWLKARDPAVEELAAEIAVQCDASNRHNGAPPPTHPGS